MPLNHYQQEVGPSLADASPGKMPDVALLEGRYCSVEHLTVAEHYKDILDFYKILISLPSGIRLQGRFWEPFTYGYYTEKSKCRDGTSDFEPALQRHEQPQKLNTCL